MNMLRIVVFVLVILLMFPAHAQEGIQPTATPSESDLQNQELLSIITELLQPDEDCQLPCFWGFVPGVSTVADVEDFWTTAFDMSIDPTLGEDGRTFVSFWIDFVPQSVDDFSISMVFREDVLRLLKVTTFDTSIWLEGDWLSLSDISQRLPNSSEIFIRVRLPGESGSSTISLVIVNIEANTMILKSYRLHIDGNIVSPNSTEPFLLCPTEDNLIYSSLWLLDDEIPISIADILGNQIVIGSELAPYQPIEFMANLSSDEFFEYLEENPEDCVEILSYSELLGLRYDF